MKLERAQEIYTDYREGTASPAMKLALEQHFDADPDARKDYEEFDSVLSALSNAYTTEVEAPHGMRARILEQAARADAQRSGSHRNPWDTLKLLVAPRPRLATLALAGMLVVAVAITSMIRPVSQKGNSAGVMPFTGSPLLSNTPTVSTVIQGVDDRQENGTRYFDLKLHLPDSLPNATVDAYAISSTDQIIDAGARNSDSLPVLQSQNITNDETVTVPIELAKAVPARSTLNIMVEWHGASPAASGTQVIFTPMNADETADPNVAPPANGNFFEKLQTVAADYHVKVIVDAGVEPASIRSWTPGVDVETALHTVANSAGCSMQKLDSNTYLVYPDSAQTAGTSL